MNAKRFLGSLVLLTILMLPRSAVAHCDSLDGPVVRDARLSLEKNDITPVLKWVKAEQEPAIRAAFAQTMKVRAGGAEARELADTWFFETVVRLHRETEGAAYTGLKPAGGDLGPLLSHADGALEAGNADDLARHLNVEIARGLRERFARVKAAAALANSSAEAGRAYVAAYVAYFHYVKALQDALQGVHSEED